jgi:hypothetical protein
MIRKMDIRKIVKSRMEDMDITANALSEKLGDKVPRRNVYAFLNEGASINLDALGKILDTLRIELVPKR